MSRKRRERNRIKNDYMYWAHDKKEMHQQMFHQVKFNVLNALLLCEVSDDIITVIEILYDI